MVRMKAAEHEEVERSGHTGSLRTRPEDEWKLFYIWVEFRGGMTTHVYITARTEQQATAKLLRSWTGIKKHQTLSVTTHDDMNEKRIERQEREKARNAGDGAKKPVQPNRKF